MSSGKKTQEEIIKDRIALWNMPLNELLTKKKDKETFGIKPFLARK